ncbi:MAG: flagellar motor switch protein FliN [Gammaproteobacteria bacterium]|nr:flagellar motor switch protein FliN [Gammaproteobacteria bacterium]
MASEETGNEESANEEAAQVSEKAAQYSPDELSDAGQATESSEVNLELVLDIPVNVCLRVGSTEISIRDLVKLVEGSVIALDRDANEPMDVLVNGTLIAHGEIVVVDDRFGIRLTDVVSPLERIEKLG